MTSRSASFTDLRTPSNPKLSSALAYIELWAEQPEDDLRLVEMELADLIEWINRDLERRSILMVTVLFEIVNLALTAGAVEAEYEVSSDYQDHNQTRRRTRRLTSALVKVVRDRINADLYRRRA